MEGESGEQVGEICISRECAVRLVLYCFIKRFLEQRQCTIKYRYKECFHSIHNVVDRGVLQAMWEELAGKVGHRDQLIICQPRLSENAL